MDNDVGKLFIGGISWETTEDKLRDHFGKYGEIVDSVVMKEKSTGRARGFGFVVFADPADADRALLDQHTIDGRVVDAKKAVPRDEQNNDSRAAGPQTKKIFVGGLAVTVTEEDFKRYFAQFGAITDAVVMYDPGTQRPRGFGFITYDCEEAVEIVLQKSFHELNGKMVEVKAAIPKELSIPGGRVSGGRGAAFNGGYGQGYKSGSLSGSLYGDRIDNQYGRPASGRAGFPSYGSVEYGVPSYNGADRYGSAMNGGYHAGGDPGNSGYVGISSYSGEYGGPPAVTGYGSTGGYGSTIPSGRYGNTPLGSQRSPWGSSGTGYFTGGDRSDYGPPSGGMSGYGSGGLGNYGNSGWESGFIGGHGMTGYQGNVDFGGHGSADPGYGTGTASYFGKGGSYGSGPSSEPYGQSGYQMSVSDPRSSPLPVPGGVGYGGLARDGYGRGIGYGGPVRDGYGVAGKQSQRGSEARFRPYPSIVKRSG